MSRMAASSQDRAARASTIAGAALSLDRPDIPILFRCLRDVGCGSVHRMPPSNLLAIGVSPSQPFWRCTEARPWRRARSPELRLQFLHPVRGWRCPRESPARGQGGPAPRPRPKPEVRFERPRGASATSPASCVSGNPTRKWIILIFRTSPGRISLRFRGANGLCCTEIDWERREASARDPWSCKTIAPNQLGHLGGATSLPRLGGNVRGINGRDARPSRP
jgi:hypothetical protein